jgi:signal transduction histidine kinase
MKAQTDLAVHGLVHDLNNVFATILDAADVLETDPRWASLAGVVQRNALLGQRILGGFAGSCGAPVGVDALLESAGAVAADSLHAQGCAVEFRCECEPGLEIRGSSIAWERAIVNLLINAGQAMGCAGGVVTIRARRADSGVEITITDCGPGIPCGDLARIFEPGFSTKPSRSGLGLHIAASIVEQNGGSISAANRADGNGAVFRIVAPGS